MEGPFDRRFLLKGAAGMSMLAALPLRRRLRAGRNDRPASDLQMSHILL